MLILLPTDKSEEMKIFMQKEKNYMRQSIKILKKISQKINDDFEKINQSKSDK